MSGTPGDPDAQRHRLGFGRLRAVLHDALFATGRRRATFVIQAFKSVELPTQFLLSLLAARELPANQFGIATILISVQAAYFALATFGFDEMLQRAVASARRESQPLILATAYRARLVSCAIGVVLGGAGAALAAALHSGLALPLLWLGIGSAAMVASNMYQAIALATYRVTATAVASYLSWFVPVVLALAGLVHTTGGYMAALAGGSLVRLLVSSSWLTATKDIPRRERIRRNTARLLGTPAAHASLAAFNITNLVLARHGDVFVAGLVGLSSAVIGSYGLAWQIASAANTFLLIGLGALGLSRMSEYLSDTAAFGRFWYRFTRLAATISLGPMCCLALVAAPATHLLFGTKYPHLAGLLEALLATQWASRITGSGTNIAALIALGRMEYVARTAIISAGLNLVLDAAFSLLVGAYGLAAGSAVATVVVGIWNADQVTRHLAAHDPQGTAGGSTWRIRWRTHYPGLHLAGLSVVFAVSALVGISHAPDGAKFIAAGAISLAWAGACLREARGMGNERA